MWKNITKAVWKTVVAVYIQCLTTESLKVSNYSAEPPFRLRLPHMQGMQIVRASQSFGCFRIKRSLNEEFYSSEIWWIWWLSGLLLFEDSKCEKTRNWNTVHKRKQKQLMRLNSESQVLSICWIYLLDLFGDMWVNFMIWFSFGIYFDCWILLHCELSLVFYLHWFECSWRYTISKM